MNQKKDNDKVCDDAGQSQQKRKGKTGSDEERLPGQPIDELKEVSDEGRMVEDGKPGKPDDAVLIRPSQTVIGERSSESVKGNDIIGAHGVEGDDDFEKESESGQSDDAKVRMNRCPRRNSGLR